MKKYSNGIFIFAIVLIITSYCYAQGDGAKANATQGANKIKSQPVYHFPFDRPFFKEMPISKLNPKSVQLCKNNFTKICGPEDYPKIKKFADCLHNNFNAFKQNPDCSNLAHALIHANFLSYSNRTIQQCKVFFEKCEQDIKTGKTKTGALVCVNKEPLLTPVCTILANVTLNYRMAVAKIYETRLVKD